MEGRLIYEVVILDWPQGFAADFGLVVYLQSGIALNLPCLILMEVRGHCGSLFFGDDAHESTFGSVTSFVK